MSKYFKVVFRRKNEYKFSKKKVQFNDIIIFIIDINFQNHKIYILEIFI